MKGKGKLPVYYLKWKIFMEEAANYVDVKTKKIFRVMKEGRKMKTKWKMFAKVEKEKEYLAIVSSLTLKSFWNNIKFMKFGMVIENQLAKTKGLVGYSMSMEPFARKYGTLSVWESEDDLMKFTKELPHGKVMEEMKPCLEADQYM